MTIKGLILVAPVMEWEFCAPEKQNAAYWHGFDITYDYKQIINITDQRVILSDLLEYDVRGKYCEYLAKKIDAKLRIITAQRKHITSYEEPEVLVEAKRFLPTG